MSTHASPAATGSRPTGVDALYTPRSAVSTVRRELYSTTCGERAKSIGKIALTVLATLIAIALIISACSLAKGNLLHRAVNAFAGKPALWTAVATAAILGTATLGTLAYLCSHSSNTDAFEPAEAL